MRSVHALGCRDGLPRDALAELSLQAVTGDQVNGAPEQMLEVLLHVDYPEEADGPGELHEEVPIATRTGSTAGERAERREGADSELGQLGTVLGQNAEDVVTFQAPVLSGGQRNPNRWHGYLDGLQPNSTAPPLRATGPGEPTASILSPYTTSGSASRVTWTASRTEFCSPARS